MCLVGKYHRFFYVTLLAHVSSHYLVHLYPVGRLLCNCKDHSEPRTP